MRKEWPEKSGSDTIKGLCSLSSCPCLPERLIFCCCVPFLPSLAPPYYYYYYYYYFTGFGTLLYVHKH